jgi:hypothetical protein
VCVLSASNERVKQFGFPESKEAGTGPASSPENRFSGAAVDSSLNSGWHVCLHAKDIIHKRWSPSREF